MATCSYSSGIYTMDTSTGGNCQYTTGVYLYTKSRSRIELFIFIVIYLTFILGCEVVKLFSCVVEMDMSHMVD